MMKMEKGETVFSQLVKPLRDLLDERGFDEPTLPQKEGIPPIMDDDNALLIAPAGTGKTEAAILPILDKVLRNQQREGIKMIYITPLRALNRDILQRLKWWCKNLDLKVSVRHGDTSKRERRQQALSPPDVLVTTPETFQLLLTGKRLSKHAANVEWVVVDEVHELAGNKRGVQLSLSMERMRRMKAGDFQVVGLSATVGSPEEVGKFLVGEGRDCEVVDVSMVRENDLDVLYPDVSDSDEVLSSEIYTYPEVAARVRRMRELIEEHETTLIFTNTRPMSEVLSSRFRMWDMDFPVSVHHGSLSTYARRQTEKELKTGDLKGVICTSSMELGIDIGLVDLVIQYNSPRQVARLLQRIGRSGHKITKKSKGRIIVKDSTDGVESSIVIDRSRRKELEPVKIPEKPLDVLSHELVGMLVAAPEWQVEDVLSLLKRAYPFRDLEKEDILKVLKYMEDMNPSLAWLRSDEEVFSRPSKGDRVFDYFFGKLSMIPEMKQYAVVDDTKDEAVGVLDEPFVAEYGEPGAKFVMGGSIWKIVQVFKDKVFVKPVDDPVGAVPSWVGEEIPVPFSIAQEVGELRKQLESLLESGNGSAESFEAISNDWDLDQRTMEKSLKPVEEQFDNDLEIPTHEKIVLEKSEDTVVIHSCFGTLVNRTLARYIARRAADELGETVAVTIDPYRILVRSERLMPREIRAIFCGEMGTDFRETLEEVIEESRFFKWRIIQIGRRMGAIEKDTDMTASEVDQMVEGLKNTPVYEETFKEVVRKDLDLSKALEVLKEVESGDIQLKSLGLRADPSPIAEPAWEEKSLKFEPVSPKRMRRLILGSVRARLLSKERTFACAECKEWSEVKEVHELSEPPTCPNCGSERLGLVEEEVGSVRRALSRVKENSSRGEDKDIWREIKKTSKLVKEHGKPAAAALIGKGMTYSGAEKILEKEDEINDDFLDMVINEEKRSLLSSYTDSSD